LTASIPTHSYFMDNISINILSNISFCFPKRKENHTGLEQRDFYMKEGGASVPHPLSA